MRLVTTLIVSLLILVACNSHASTPAIPDQTLSDSSALPESAALQSAPMPMAVGFASPGPSPSPGLVPLHVHALTWYQGENINTDIPATWMAQHYDFTEQGEAGGTVANAYIAAGGKFAMLYSDPELGAKCSSPFATANGAKPGACTGNVGNVLNANETAWLHDKFFNRLHVTANGTQLQGQWQDRMNPNSTAVASSYHTWATNVIAGSRWNLFEIDDIQSDYMPSYFTYKFSATSREFDALGTTANAVWLTGQKRIVAAAPKPVIVNGITGVNETALLTAPNVLGHMIESCATTITNAPISGSLWISNMNTLLRATALHRYGICVNYMPTTSNGTFQRLYGLASWWLTYDPTYSVIFNDIPTADHHWTYPEHGITLFGPLQTATSNNITTLRRSTGVYVREFAYCYVQKVAIGPCATVVNPDSFTHTVPTLTRAYKHSLALSTKSWYAGGTVQWATMTTTLTSLNGLQARILKL